MTKQEIATIERAKAQGRDALMRTLAIIHRSGSSRTKRQIYAMISDAGANGEFIFVLRSGALIHVSEA